MSRLDDLDSLISNLDEEEKENLGKAKRAAEEKIRAEQAAETAKINKAKIEEAKAKYQEAQNIVGSLGIKYEGDANVPSKKSQNFLGKVSNLRFASGFLAGVVALSLLGGAYLLGRKSYTGTIRNSNSISQTADDYEELTDEKFYELCDTLYKKYTDAGLAVSKEGVTKYAMVVNIDKLALDNPNLINNIVNGENIDEFFSDVNLVISAIISENFINWCEKGLGTNSFLNASDAVFDEKQKEIVKMYEEKVYSLEKLINNPSKFNAELSYFLEECIKPHSDLFNLESGPGYATMLIVMNVITGPYSLGTTLLDSYNTKEMKNFVIYSGATKEEENNSRVTGYYSGIKDILDDCNVKTLTK